MTVWFTADHHFGHENIMRHAGRPYDTVAEMDEALVDNWNRNIKPADTVYHLGDFVWGNWSQKRIDQQVQELNGHKYLIYGNHDSKRVRRSEGWVWKGNYKRIKIESQDICLFHYACRVWDKMHYGSWHLYGHSHGSLADVGFSTDVGVDAQEYRPVSFELLRDRIFSDRKFVAVDHHGASDG